MGKLIWGTLLFCCVTGMTAADEEYRTFTNADGQDINARIVDYDHDAERVQLELQHGRKGWILCADLSEADQAFIGRWIMRARFLDPGQFQIEVTEDDSGWKHDGDASRDRKERWTQYFFKLSNRGDVELKDLQLVYCLYREKRGGLGVDHYDLELQPVPAGKTVEAKGRVRHGSFKVPSANFINDIVGARFRFFWQASDGNKWMREVCLPPDLSDEKFPWKEPAVTEAQEAARPRPEVDLTPKDLTKDDIESLAKKYADTWEDHDFAAWRELLEPFHFGSRDLAEGVFNRYEVSDVDIKEVEGLNVYVQMTYEGGHKQRGWLQFHPSGHLKYTPLLFKHPVAEILTSFHLLFHNDSSWSGGVLRSLSEASIPSFGYTTDGSIGDRLDAIEKIYAWLEENGAAYDVGESGLAIPEEQFEELMKKARTYVRNRSFYGGI